MYLCLLALSLSFVVSLCGCGSGDRADVLQVLNESDENMARLDAAIQETCKGLRDALAEAPETMPGSAVKRYDDLLATLKSQQESRERLRLIVSHEDLVCLAAHSGGLARNIQQTSDLSRRASLTSEHKSADAALDAAIQESRKKDGLHATAFKTDQRLREAFSQALSIQLFLGNAIGDADEAITGRVKGAIDSYTAFQKMRSELLSSLADLGQAGAERDVNERQVAVATVAEAIAELASKEQEIAKESRRLRLSR